jgi:formamidopyrimidine-DNA glycosylase
MPELPDITLYLEALEPRIVGQILERTRIVSPFLLRTFEPPIESLYGKPVTALRGLGKRIAIQFDGDVWLVLHLMIAGRLHWKPAGAKLTGKIGLAAFDFTNGSSQLTLRDCRRGESAETGSRRYRHLHHHAG